MVKAVTSFNPVRVRDAGKADFIKPVRFDVRMPSEIIVSDGIAIADAALFAIQIAGFFCKRIHSDLAHLLALAQIGGRQGLE
ncbi:Uncharacterised protein [Neisseria lactamica]|uniref:Uncharacterized protein n=1 Tax=Neisseria lactamica TaxID=486 RepID=A0AAU8VJC5_NEILA|nr:hypothetical protein B2G52_06535 [Neisseria lactamica]KFJ37258.1 putative identified by MetaGeneAnnotator [Neisseria lactamica ATCC 23970]CBX22025.1 unnamed protein product [Neisseria lactamica Y92-1009]VTQ47843.1 Uncharacterised protein [Neisseria lactamica]